jgi:hypothetical protein
MLIAVSGGARGDDDGGGKSFGFLAAGYTQKLWGATSNLRSILGGVAVLQNGDVIAAECVFTGTWLHRFAATDIDQDTGLHRDDPLRSDGGCGIVFHPSGKLYLNNDPCPGKDTCLDTKGIVEVDPETGSVLNRFGPPGNALGIAVRPAPAPAHLVYAGHGCRAGSTSACMLFVVDPATRTVAYSIEVKEADVGVKYIDALYFDPSGEFLFVANRFPEPPRLTILRIDYSARKALFVRDVPVHGGGGVDVEPIGMGFHAAPPRFIATNNNDGSISRFDFPRDDYTQAPTESLLAAEGYRGDLMQAGPDGCLYVTQAGTTYDNGGQDPESNSIVQICESAGPGFTPPPGIVPVPRDTVPPTTTATLSPPANAAGWNRSDVLVTLAAIDNAGGSGVKEITYTVAGAQNMSTTEPGSAATLVISSEGTSTITFFATDNAGNGESPQTRTVRIDKTPPAVTIRASQTELWPPNGKNVLDVISGSFTDLAGVDLESVTFEVIDSYRQIQPKGKAKAIGEDGNGQYSFDLSLEARRAGQDEDGRTYTVIVTVTDRAGNVATASIVITVPHDQGHGEK